MLRDLGISGETPDLETDSAAAKGTMSRRGVGGIRHLETATLCLQQSVADRTFTVTKIEGTRNVADIATKHLERPAIDRLLSLLNCHVVAGRSGALPQLR